MCREHYATRRVFQEVLGTIHDSDEQYEYRKNSADSAFIENTQRNPLYKKNPAHQESGKHEENVNSKSA